MNSSEAEPAAAKLLQAGIDLLASESPAHHLAMCRVLSGLSVRLELGAEQLGVERAGERLRVGPAAARAAVKLCSDLATTLALVDGELTLIEAVESGRVDVFGLAADLFRAADGLDAFIEGLVRCPSAPELVNALRRIVTGQGEHHG